MTKQARLPADSKAYAEQAYRAKEALRRRRARMSFKRKLEALDRMREMARSLPRLEGQGCRRRAAHGSKSPS